MSKSVSDSLVRIYTKSLVAECRVMTERDEDVKSLTAAIRLGGSEMREERQEASGKETTERIGNGNDWRGGMKALCLTVSLLAGWLGSVLLGTLGGLECVCVCVHLLSSCPERFHGCSSFQCTCRASSTAECLNERSVARKERYKKRIKRSEQMIETA